MVVANRTEYDFCDALILPDVVARVPDGRSIHVGRGELRANKATIEVGKPVQSFCTDLTRTVTVKPGEYIVHQHPKIDSCILRRLSGQRVTTNFSDVVCIESRFRQNLGYCFLKPEEPNPEQE